MKHSDTFCWENQTNDFTKDYIDMVQEWIIGDIFCAPNEFYEWINENTSYDWTILGIPHKNTLSYFIFFEDNVDATAFKLKWL